MSDAKLALAMKDPETLDDLRHFLAVVEMLEIEPEADVSTDSRRIIVCTPLWSVPLWRDDDSDSDSESES